MMGFKMTVFVLYNSVGNILGVYSSIENVDKANENLRRTRKVVDQYGGIAYFAEDLTADCTDFSIVEAFELDDIYDETED